MTVDVVTDRGSLAMCEIVVVSWHSNLATFATNPPLQHASDDQVGVGKVFIYVPFGQNKGNYNIASFIRYSFDRLLNTNLELQIKRSVFGL